MKNYFFCYSKRVSDFLASKGIQFITVAIEPKTKKMFSLYEINEELQKALDQYKQ
ncbi:DUF5659 domain-containing protein [Bacillus marinisedimentorum]|uniref:DUF5659 domain-containing protein n=1 Tax=Bacillus marinisedimentorum TaxID=1821260 RepID=UPI000A6CA9E9|nr:DUF5659 domain-containing protein [Bacillus marinisedimentorum]